MIDSIIMKNVAVYSKRTTFSDCKKVNLIYGDNGTGKTILCNYLMDPNNPAFQNCSISWENSQPLSIFVFNRKFCEDNFSQTEIPGIFTLGRINTAIAEKEELIRKDIQIQKQKLSELQSNDYFLRAQKQDKQQKCIESLWSRMRTYKQMLGDFFPRPISKTKCFKNVENTIAQGLKNDAINILDLKYRADVLNTNKEVEYSIYPYFDNTAFAKIEENPVWSTSISDPYGSWVDPERSQKEEWIRQGALYMKEDQTCPFCKQRINSEQIISQLRSTKTDDYRQKKALCDELAIRYEKSTHQFLNTAERILKENRDEGAAFLENDQFSDILINLQNLFHANLLFMQRKRGTLSLSVKLQSCKRLIEELNTLIADSNTRSSQANSMLMNIRKSKTRLKKEAWDSYCEASRSDIQTYAEETREINEEISKITETLRQYQATIQQMESQLEELLRNTVNIRESVDRINTELDTLGIHSFRLELSENQKSYMILRKDGSSAATTLSEGEKTMVMLLYFLQLIEGSTLKENIRTERVIVIDDPVSNLDDTALNAVLKRIGILITKILDGDDSIQQLFVLSHRKECTKFLRTSDYRLDNEQVIKLWILKKKDGITQPQEFVLSRD